MVNEVTWVNFPVLIRSENEELLSDKASENLQYTNPKELIGKELDK